MWECEWRTYKRANTIRNRYVYPTERQFRMSQQQIIDHIEAGTIFGAVEVDIHVPEGLKPFFSEMCPIFKNTTVKLADIGEHMQEYINKSNQSFTERRYLIGSMFATKQLFITPLLQYYLKLGLKITKVYQVVEFAPKECFVEFADSVSDDRRAGDGNPELKVIADTSKLIG